MKKIASISLLAIIFFSCKKNENPISLSKQPPEINKSHNDDLLIKNSPEAKHLKENERITPIPFGGGCLLFEDKAEFDRLNEQHTDKQENNITNTINNNTDNAKKDFKKQ